MGEGSVIVESLSLSPELGDPILESLSKRRLSLRIEERNEKKSRAQAIEPEQERPSTSSKGDRNTNPDSRIAASETGGLAEEEEGQEQKEDKQHHQQTTESVGSPSRLGDIRAPKHSPKSPPEHSLLHSFPSSTRLSRSTSATQLSSSTRSFMPPGWKAMDIDDSGPSRLYDANPSARTRSSRDSASPASRSLSSSAPIPSHFPSPPPSFNLSTGQPLVNPPPKTQAAFVGKLYQIIEDEERANSGLIYWSADGTIFTCPNPTEFANAVLPRYFKHKNWQSFVRQLNMYSFSKVSRVDRDGRVYRLFADAEQVHDLYAANTDPQAWEFRHPLFRRGETHLLAQIKRKNNRTSGVESQTATSPMDEYEVPKHVAGWMPVAGPSASSTSSPPQANRESRSSLFDYAHHSVDSLSRRASKERRKTSTGDHVETITPGAGGASGPSSSHRLQSSGGIQRFHPDPNRPPLTAPPLGGHAPFPESPYYPQPSQASPVDQFAVLEDRIQRLTDVLNAERIEHVRSSLDFSSYLLQVTGWMVGGRPPNPSDIRALQETLKNVSGAARHRYEDLMASNTLASLASAGTARNRDERASDHSFVQPTLPVPSRPSRPSLSSNHSEQRLSTERIHQITRSSAFDIRQPSNDHYRPRRTLAPIETSSSLNPYTLRSPEVASAMEEEGDQDDDMLDDEAGTIRRYPAQPKGEVKPQVRSGLASLLN